MKLKFSHSFLFTLASALIFSLLSCASFKNKEWDGTQIINPQYSDFTLALDEYLQGLKYQGAVLVGKGHDIIFAKGFGRCDPNDEKSRVIFLNATFETGSISKQMTAAAIMQLAQKKKLSVQDKLSKYFPDYEHGDEITIEMLLNMRSGLTDHINEADEFFPINIYRLIEKNQLACKPVDKDLVLTYFYDAPLLAKPNSTYFYCNTNYFLLAKIIEQVSGMSYQDYIKKNIFKKAGMTHSNLSFQGTDTKSYDRYGRYYSIPESLAVGCGDVNSCVTDLFKWNVLLAEGKIVNRKSLRQMIDTESYGYGVYVKNKAMFHSGTTNVFNSYNYYDFDNELSIIVLANRPIYVNNATFIAENIKTLYKNFDK
ncbi:MAG: beta-lactamase family protein [Treponema sp.]|nr:beta-lactamase family protein [Treponema sp.]